MNTIGERIKYLRESKKITQQELAEKTNISRGNLSNYEKDRFKPASDTIIALAEFFNVSTDWLLTGKEHKTEMLEKKQEENVHSILGDLTDQEVNVIQLLRRLDEREQIKVEGMLEMKVLESMEKKKGRSSNYQNGEEAATIEEKKHA